MLGLLALKKIVMRKYPSQFGQILAILSLVLLVSQPLTAAVITVEGDCTLADAIHAANSDAVVGGCPGGSGPDTIVLTYDVALTEVDNRENCKNGLPSVTTDVTIEGNGFAIRRVPGAPDFRILFQNGGSFALSSVTVSNGFTTCSGGGVSSLSGQLILTNTTVTGNHGSLTAGGVHAGWQVDTDITDSTIAGNSGNGAYTPYVSVRGSRIVDNSRGGLVVYRAFIADSTIANNRGTGIDGNIGGGGQVELVNSTVSGNNSCGVTGNDVDVTGSTVSRNGCGILALTDWYYHSGQAHLVNSTVSGNRGHGLHIEEDFNIVGYGTVRNSTIVGNHGFGVFFDEGEAMLVPRLSDSVVAGNLDGNCGGGGIEDRGNNYGDDDTCGGGFGTLTGLDPVLADNGGPTKTHALLAGSSAIDAAGDCGLESDQRGRIRADGICDSGAFERVLITLQFSGTCPGDATFEVRGAMPGDQVALLHGTALGTSIVPGGSCAGLELALEDPTPITSSTADEEGSFSLSATLPSAACGSFLQAADKGVCEASNVEEISDCFVLSTRHSGSGDDPMASPSLVCPASEHQAGRVIDLLASPDPSWGVGGWIGTDDDAGMEPTNTATMPASDHEVAVDYVRICFPLTLDHTGSGGDPAASPPGSPGCVGGDYLPGVVIHLTASPEEAWEIGGWTGTDDDDSAEPTNTLTMPAGPHVVSVHYEPSCYPLTLDHTGGGIDPVATALADGSAWIERVVDSSFNEAESVFSADVDGDGDLDVLGAAARSDASVTWWENSFGDGTAWIEHVVDGSFDGASSVYSADVDGDGDLDVLGAAEFADDIRWWENIYGGTCPVGEFHAGDRVELKAVPDLGWQIGGWTGTEDDGSTEEINFARMPAEDHSVAVHYVLGRVPRGSSQPRRLRPIWP